MKLSYDFLTEECVANYVGPSIVPCGTPTVCTAVNTKCLCERTRSIHGAVNRNDFIINHEQLARETRWN